MRPFHAFPLAALLLAGCLTPGNAPPAVSAPEAAFPNSLDVDLHEYVLNITMPEGQPTMLVALNVTKDMWVRLPHGRYDAAFHDGWILCPWIRSVGLPTEFQYGVLAFWLESQTLTKAAAAMAQFDPHNVRRGDESRGWCENPSDTRFAASQFILGPQPRDATLVLLVSIVRPLQSYDATAPPAFSFMVGIGHEECGAPPTQFDPVPTALCPPQARLPAEPQVRGGEVRQAAYLSMAGPCRGCGFDVNDGRVGAAVGTVTATRPSNLESGIIYVGGKSTANPATRSPGGIRNDLTTTLVVDGRTTEGTCRSRDGDSVVSILASHSKAASMTVTIDTAGIYDWWVWMWEFPLDLTHVGWSLSPLTYFWTWPHSWSAGEDVFCS